MFPGVFCNAQGFLLNSGGTGSAIWSFVIATHSFLVLVGGRRCPKWMTGKSRRLTWVSCFCIWSLVIFVGIVGIVLIEKVQTEKGPFCKLLIKAFTD